MKGNLPVTAKGQMLGYLFQPDRALVLLSNLSERDQSVSIELIDDVNVHNADGTVVLTEQDKHSISQGNSTFSDSSKDLWRTLEIWINQIKNNNLCLELTKFNCVTNKSIPKNYIISKISRCNEEIEANNIISSLDLLKKDKENALKIKTDKGNEGKSLQGTIQKMSYVLSDKDLLVKLIEKIELKENQTLEVINDTILNNIHITQDNYYSDKILFYLKTWLTERCKLLVNSKASIIITKEDFNYAVQDAKDSFKLSDIVFTAQSQLELTINENDKNRKINNVFVKQLKTIKHRDIQNIILDAIIEFLCYEKEVINLSLYSHITALDFENLEEFNKKRWKKIFNKYVIDELEDYTEKELDKIAFHIYDDLTDLEVIFKGVNVSSTYFKNGAYHKLADELKIGWHPKWKKLFKK